MAKLELIQSLFGYHYVLHERLWECIMHLNEQQFGAEVAYSHGSVRNQVIHLAGAEGRWLRGLQAQPDARAFRPLPEDYPTREEAYRLCAKVAVELQAYVASLDEAALHATPAGMPGPVWQALLHVANHGADHRAQILRILHDLGAPTFEQDLILYLWR